MKTILVAGAGGFIGSHLVRRLKEQDAGYVVGVDLKLPEYLSTESDEFHVADLRDCQYVEDIFHTRVFDEVYQLAADMGGAEYINTGVHDPDVMYNSLQINLNIAARHAQIKKLFYSSSACVYPEHNQMDPDNPVCAEDTVYPAFPDSEYGWEKLFSERLYTAYMRNYAIDVRIARFHNIFGECGIWTGGKEKAPAAICRKVASTTDGIVDIFGDGQQTRTFLHIDDCLSAVQLLMKSSVTEPLNIGSEDLISINDLTRLVADIAGKEVTINNIAGPEGVRGRSSDNTKILALLGWQPQLSLRQGMERTYKWIEKQLYT